MTVDKSQGNAAQKVTDGNAAVPAVPTEQRPEQLRSSMRQGPSRGLTPRIEIPSKEERLRPSESLNSLASTDCAASNAGRSSSRSVSESSLSLDQQPSSSSAANLPPVPRSFMCPISLQVMTDPVCTVDGMIYDRQNIEAFFRSGRCTSPVTGMQLDSLKLRPNAALKEAIEAYLELQREAECQWKDWEAYMQEHAQRSQQKLAKKRLQLRELRAALETSERQILALELGNKTTKRGYAPSSSSSAPSSSTGDESSSAAGVLESPLPRPEAQWKGGRAPRPDPNLMKRPQARKGGLLSFFR